MSMPSCPINCVKAPPCRDSSSRGSSWVEFQKWAKIGKFLGFFPVQFPNRTGNRPPGGKWYNKWYFSATFVHCLLAYLLSSAFISIPLPRYITEYVLKGANITSTDRFALAVFIACIHIIRVIAPFFAIFRANQATSIVRRMKEYDENAGVGVVDDSTSLKFVDYPILGLFLSSSIVTYSNFSVIKSDFGAMMVRQNDPLIPISTLAFGNKWIATLFLISGQIYAELATSFLITVIYYISKFVEHRMSLLEQRVRQQANNSFKAGVPLNGEHCYNPQLSLPDLPIPSASSSQKEMVSLREVEVEDHNILECELVQKLMEIVDSLTVTFRSFILTFFVFTTLIAIVSIYMITMSLRLISVTGSLCISQRIIIRGFHSLGTTGFHTVYRILVLINIGERIENSGKKLLTSVCLADVTKLSCDAGAKINQLRWLLHGCEFSVRPWHMFTLNRQVMASILASVVTFVIVLQQFRVVDTLPVEAICL